VFEVEKCVCVNCQNISRYIFETSVRHLKKYGCGKTGRTFCSFFGGTYSKMEWLFCSPYDIFINFLKTEIELSCVVCVCLCVCVLCVVWYALEGAIKKCARPKTWYHIPQRGQKIIFISFLASPICFQCFKKTAKSAAYIYSVLCVQLWSSFWVLVEI